MKFIIAGGRHYHFTKQDMDLLDAIHKRWTITEVVSGMAQGADLGGVNWARQNYIYIAKFPANWYEYGYAAGPIRNDQMANYADALIAFPGGIGTANMVRKAKAKGLLVYQVTTPAGAPYTMDDVVISGL